MHRLTGADLRHFWCFGHYDELSNNVLSRPATAPDLLAKTTLASLEAYSKNRTADPDLEALFCQFGRYLLISCSRPGSLPAKPTIGRWGQLQEWEADKDDPEDDHRHVSHLFAVYPGRQITQAATPELADAARVSLQARGDKSTGWSTVSRSQMICLSTTKL